jgi:hypothetical protein
MQINFGDGTVPVSLSPPSGTTTHTYAAPGTYFAVVIATSAGQTGQAGVSVTVTSTPQVGTVQPGTAAITTDRQQYNIGDNIQVCYHIPIAGYITITDLPSSQQTHVFYQGTTTSTNGCLPGTITPPAGNECLILTYPLLGGTGRTQTCFWVNGQPPPTGWVDIGSAQVDTSGTFSFDGQVPVATNLTVLRVTSGTCSANPASTLVWEGALQRAPGTAPGLEVWSAALQPVGLAVSNGGNGYGLLLRPVTTNPVTHVDATVLGVGIINTGATFQVCLRAP